MSNLSRRRFLVAGLTASSVLALGAGAGAYLFFSRLSTSARPLPPEAREFDLGNHGVNTVTWSPNGHAFAAGGATNQVKIWRTSDGQELTRLVGPTSNAGAWSIAWSPESTYFAIAWTGDRISIWKVPADENASLWDHERDLLISRDSDVWPMVVAWSPDGTRLAVGDLGGGLQVWNPHSGQALRVLQASQVKTEIPVSSLVWSPDGTQIVTLNVAADAKYTVWNATTGVAMRLPSPNGIPTYHTGWWNNRTAVGWSPDGTTLAGSSGGNVLVWEWDEKRKSWGNGRSIPVTTWMMTALTWSPDSKRFATADRDNKVRIWLASTGQQLGSYSISPPQVGGWDQDSRAQEYMDTDFEIGALAWSPDGKHLLSGNSAGRVLLWGIH